MYTLNEDETRGLEKTKIAIQVPKRGNWQRKTVCFDRKDRNFSFEVMSTILSSDDMQSLAAYVINSRPIAKQKQDVMQFAVGNIVECSGTHKIKLRYIEYDTLSWKKYLQKCKAHNITLERRGIGYMRGTNFFHKRRFEIVRIEVQIKKSAIKRAKIIKILSSAIIVEVLEIDEATGGVLLHLQKELLSNIRINMTTKKDVKIVDMPSNCEVDEPI